MYTYIYTHIHRYTPMNKSEHVSRPEDAVKVAPRPAPSSCRMVCFIAQDARKMAPHGLKMAPQSSTWLQDRPAHSQIEASVHTWRSGILYA